MGSESTPGIHAEGFRAFRGEDERLALQYAAAAVESAEPDEIARGLDDPEELWRLRRVAHGLVRDRGGADGLSLYERLALQNGVRRLVTDTRFVRHVLDELSQEEGSTPADDRVEG